MKWINLVLAVAWGIAGFLRAYEVIGGKAEVAFFVSSVSLIAFCFSFAIDEINAIDKGNDK